MMALALALAGGCAGLDPYRTGQPEPRAAERTPVDDRAPPATAPDVPVAPPPGPAAAHLLAQAEAHAAAGDWELAAAQIERALRIERANPWLYLALADVRFAQGDAPAGRALLNRARALSGGDPRVAERAAVLSLRDTRNASPP